VVVATLLSDVFFLRLRLVGGESVREVRTALRESIVIHEREAWQIMAEILPALGLELTGLTESDAAMCSQR